MSGEKVTEIHYPVYLIFDEIGKKWGLGINYLDDSSEFSGCTFERQKDGNQYPLLGRLAAQVGAENREGFDTAFEGRDKTSKISLAYFGRFNPEKWDGVEHALLDTSRESIYITFSDGLFGKVMVDHYHTRNLGSKLPGNNPGLDSPVCSPHYFPFKRTGNADDTSLFDLDKFLNGHLPQISDRLFPAPSPEHQVKV